MFGQIYTLRRWARNGPWSKNSILKLSKAFLLSSVLLFLKILWGPQFSHFDDFLSWLKFFLEIFKNVHNLQQINRFKLKWEPKSR